MMTSSGTMMHADGTTQQGMWKEDKFEGKYQPGPADGSNTKPWRKSSKALDDYFLLHNFALAGCRQLPDGGAGGGAARGAAEAGHAVGGAEHRQLPVQVRVVGCRLLWARSNGAERIRCLSRRRVDGAGSALLSHSAAVAPVPLWRQQQRPRLHHAVVAAARRRCDGGSLTRQRGCGEPINTISCSESASCSAARALAASRISCVCFFRFRRCFCSSSFNSNKNYRDALHGCTYVERLCNAAAQLQLISDMARARTSCLFVRKHEQPGGKKHLFFM